MKLPWPGSGPALDLKAKILGILVAVIAPTFLIVTIAENQITAPLLKKEIQRSGLAVAEQVAAEIASRRLLTFPIHADWIESRLREVIYAQPNVIAIEVFARDSLNGEIRQVASTYEEDAGNGETPRTVEWTETPASELVSEETGGPGGGDEAWNIRVPVFSKKRVVGIVQLQASTGFLERMSGILWGTRAAAATVSVFVLVLGLSYVLRKTIENDRKLRRAEVENLALAERLHETERRLMTTEKLAAMGQLTASFAHEIGTPLNALGGHLHLLEGEVAPAVSGRLAIIRGQVDKIAKIVRAFLESTAKPEPRRELVDLNRLAEQTAELVRPRAQALRAEVGLRLAGDLPQIRAAPLEIEQILLNLATNSLDSLKSKAERGPEGKLALEISTATERRRGRRFAVLEVRDSGTGIPRELLPRVAQPFFTTKDPGQGTGLGLTICEELAKRNGGSIELATREGKGTRVMVRLPLEASA